MLETPYRAVYGTLKEGKGNYLAFSMNNPAVCEKIWEGWVKGYDMYVSSIPFVKPGAGCIFVQLFKFYDLSILKQIDRMETGAGYRLKSIRIPEMPETKAYIYLYPGDIIHCQKHLTGNY